MEGQKTRGQFFSAWLLIVGMIVLKDTKAAYHSLEMCFTAVGTTKSLLDFTMVGSMNGVQGSFYGKKNQQLVIKESWVSQALGAQYIEEKRQKLVYNEIDFLWALQNWIQNDTKGESNHTVQFWHDCHLDGDIHMSSHFWYAVDGETFCGINEKLKHWVAMKPEAECFRPFWEVIFPYKKIKRYMEEDCIEPLRKVLKYSSKRENGDSWEATYGETLGHGPKHTGNCHPAAELYCVLQDMEEKEGRNNSTRTAGRTFTSFSSSSALEK
uniref:MHC class I-like antigen recognition-like domain-containing protein n=1 Tax=Monodelphis domestica TaxID=13616 RepID=A0A5F8HI04_MONDO